MKASPMNGKVAMVTGVLGDIGRATALELARAGANLFLVDSSESGLEVLAGEARGQGVAVHACSADITSRDACFNVIASTIDRFGRLDALCNVANAFLPSRTEDTTLADWEFSLAFNLSAPFYLMQAALPELVNRSGAIVNVTSSAAYTANACTAAYTASKAGLLQMTKAVAAEYRSSSVRINLVSPGDLSPHSGSVSHIPADIDAAQFQRGGSRPPVTAAQVGEVIAFLASDAARAFHGECIAVDNGIGL